MNRRPLNLQSRVAIINSCASDSRDGLAIIISGLHFEDVRDDAVNLHVANEPSEKQLLGDSCTYQPEGRETQQQLG